MSPLSEPTMSTTRRRKTRHTKSHDYSSAKEDEEDEANALLLLHNGIAISSSEDDVDVDDRDDEDAAGELSSEEVENGDDFLDEVDVEEEADFEAKINSYGEEAFHNIIPSASHGDYFVPQVNFIHIFILIFKNKNFSPNFFLKITKKESELGQALSQVIENDVNQKDYDNGGL